MNIGYLKTLIFLYFINLSVTFLDASQKILLVRSYTTSYYTGDKNSITANGDAYDSKKMRAGVHTSEYPAKKNKCFKVTAKNKRVNMCYDNNSVIVKINDKGPGVSRGGYDMTPNAFALLTKSCPEGTETRIPTTAVLVACPAGI